MEVCEGILAAEHLLKEILRAPRAPRPRLRSPRSDRLVSECPRHSQNAVVCREGPRFTQTQAIGHLCIHGASGAHVIRSQHLDTPGNSFHLASDRLRSTAMFEPPTHRRVTTDESSVVESRVDGLHRRRGFLPLDMGQNPLRRRCFFRGFSHTVLVEWGNPSKKKGLRSHRDHQPSTSTVSHAFGSVKSKPKFPKSLRMNAVSAREAQRCSN